MSSVVVLITGANSGVGFAIAKVLACASERFHVIIASRTEEKAATAKSQIGSLKPVGQISTVQLDVLDDQSINNAVVFVDKQFGHLDALINNAAVGNRDPDVRKRFKATFDTNVIGPAVVAEKFRPLLLKSQSPYSIFVTSGQGSLTMAEQNRKNAIANANAYRSSKAALNMIALQEAVEYEKQGLKVFTFCPGFVVSNLRGTDEDARSGWGKAGDPEEPAKGILKILNGERDVEAGKFVHKDGSYPW